jgi:hypothetical protein
VTQLIIQWSIVAALLVSIAVQVSDYKKRKAISAELHKLIELIKGE